MPLWRVAVVLCFPIAVSAAPTVQVPVPSAAPLSGVAGAAAPGSAQGALGSLFDGAALLRPALSPVIAPAVFSAAPAARPVGRLERADRTAPGEGGLAETVPGSIFQWKPAEEAPGHGFPPIDALVRRLASRKDRRFDAGFAFGGGAGAPRVFFYGERHTDPGLIAENMFRLAQDLREGGGAPGLAGRSPRFELPALAGAIGVAGPGRGALILDEGYMGPALFGHDALRYLEAKGFDPAWLGPEGSKWPRVEVRGWDAPEPYERSRALSLRYHMALYDLNQHLHGESRGWAYYAELARKAVSAARLWRATRRVVIAERNVELDRRVAAAVVRAKEEGLSVHVIAGSEHLLERPLLMGVPALGVARARRGLAEALGDTPFRAAMPASERPRPGAEELAFAVKAAAELAAVADDVGAERGLKAGSMKGGDFLDMLAAGNARWAAEARAKAPSPRAYAAALSVQASILRVAAALIDPAQPLAGQMSRALSVWSVFAQELDAASGKGTLEAIEAEGRLFAEQVEASV